MSTKTIDSFDRYLDFIFSGKADNFLRKANAKFYSSMSLEGQEEMAFKDIELAFYDWTSFNYKDADGKSLLDIYLSKYVPEHDAKNLRNIRKTELVLYKNIKSSTEMDQIAVFKSVLDNKVYEIIDSNLRFSIKDEYVVIRLFKEGQKFIAPFWGFFIPKELRFVAERCWKNFGKGQVTSKVMLESVYGSGNNKEFDSLNKKDFTLEDLEQLKDDLQRELAQLSYRVNIAKLQIEINKKDSTPAIVFKDIFKLKFTSEQQMNKIFSMLMTLWNVTPKEGISEASVPPGPLECDIVMDMLENIDAEVIGLFGSNQLDTDKLDRKIKKVREKYLSTPLEVLDGKTPYEAIIEERSFRGDKSTII